MLLPSSRLGAVRQRVGTISSSTIPGANAEPLSPATFIGPTLRRDSNGGNVNPLPARNRARAFGEAFQFQRSGPARPDGIRPAERSSHPVQTRQVDARFYPADHGAALVAGLAASREFCSQDDTKEVSFSRADDYVPVIFASVVCNIFHLL
jgi:hypothetical protein